MSDLCKELIGKSYKLKLCSNHAAVGLKSVDTVIKKANHVDNLAGLIINDCRFITYEEAHQILNGEEIGA